jgi:hypothetical protein
MTCQAIRSNVRIIHCTVGLYPSFCLITSS